MIDQDFGVWLKHHGMHELAVLGYLVDSDATDGAILARARGILQAFGACDPQDRWAGMLMFLCKVAMKEAPSAAQRTGAVSELQVSFDREALAREALELQQEKELKRSSLDHLAQLPTVWRGKRYRRREKATNDAERAEAYRQERDKEGRHVMALVLEAKLPFSRTLERVGPDDTAAQRCCLGLAPKSLRQRLACWRPVREFLLHAHGSSFRGPPTTSSTTSLT